MHTHLISHKHTHTHTHTHHTQSNSFTFKLKLKLMLKKSVRDLINAARYNFLVLNMRDKTRAKLYLYILPINSPDP